MRHFLSISDTPGAFVREILQRAIELRRKPEPALLAGKSLVCLFEKPSLRTRVSFETAMRRLGGDAMSLSQAEVGIGGRESPEDVARVLGGMCDGIMARVLSHETLTKMAAVSPVPIINGLSDMAHPAQALADILTMIDEFSPGDVDGIRGRGLAFVGDGNNVARSLAVICAKLGVRFSICSPPGYELDPEWVDDGPAGATREKSEGGGGGGAGRAAVRFGCARTRWRRCCTRMRSTATRSCRWGRRTSVRSGCGCLRGTR